MNTNTKKATVRDFFKCLLDKREYCKKLAKSLQDLNLEFNDINIFNKLSPYINNAYDGISYSETEIESEIDNFVRSANEKLKELEESKTELSNESKIREINNNIEKIYNSINEVLKFRKIFSVSVQSDIISSKDLDMNTIDFIKKCINNLTTKNITEHLKEFKKSELIIKKFFELISSREDKEEFLLFLEKNQKILDNNIVATSFINNIEKFLTYTNNFQCLTLLSDISINKSNLAQNIVISDGFNKQADFKYDIFKSVLADNLINTAFKVKFEAYNKSGQNREKNDIFNFFLIKKYLELDKKNNKNKNEDNLFVNIKELLNISDKQQENNLLLKFYGINNIKEFDINKNIDKLIDLVYLGVISYSDININTNTLLAFVDEVINNIFSGPLITNCCLNENIKEFINASFVNLESAEQKDKILDKLFILKKGKIVIADIENCGQKRFFDLKKDLLDDFKKTTDKNNEKVRLYENVIAIEETNYNNNTKNIENNIAEISKILDNNTNKYGNLLINYHNTFSRINSLKPRTTKKSMKFNNLIEKGNINLKSLNEILKEDHSLKNLLNEYLKQLGFNEDNLTIEFKNKTSGANDGFFANIYNESKIVKKIFVKKENKATQKEISQLFGENVCIKIHSTSIDDSSTYILTESVGLSDLSENVYKNDEFFKNKDEKYLKNFAKSFTEIYVNGYILGVQDIRGDNIRIDDQGRNTLIDWIRENKQPDKFCEEPIYLLNMNENDSVRNLFNGLFFQYQLCKCINIQPKNDGTQHIFENILKKIGQEEFKKILVEQISKSFFEIVKNYESLEDKNKNTKTIMEECSKKFNELYNVIYRYCPEVCKELDEKIYQNLENNDNKKYVEQFDKNIKVAIFNKIINNIHDNNIKNEIINFRGNGTVVLSKKTKDTLTYNLRNFSEDFKLSFWKNLYTNYNRNCAYNAITGEAKTIDVKHISLLLKKTKNEELTILLDEIKNLKKCGINNINNINNINTFSNSFLNPNKQKTSNNKEQSLTLDFPIGDYKEIFKKGFKTAVRDEWNTYSITFKKLTDINFSLIEFVHSMRIDGITTACEKYKIDVDIRDKNNIKCNDMKIFRKNKIKNDLLEAFEVENKIDEIFEENDKNHKTLFESLRGIREPFSLEKSIEYSFTNKIRNNKKIITELTKSYQ